VNKGGKRKGWDCGSAALWLLVGGLAQNSPMRRVLEVIREQGVLLVSVCLFNLLLGKAVYSTEVGSIEVGSS
jgi:hypothetical protein